MTDATTPTPASIRMEIKAMMMDPVSKMPVVVLHEPGSERYLPIWIGVCEANAIALRMEGVATPRPMTHDLALSLLAATQHAVDHVHIHTLREGVFFAEIHLKNGDRACVVDARPSDAIAIALRAEAPIMVSEEVLEHAHHDDGRTEEVLRAVLERLRPEDLGEYEM
jgi:bifunctional DNase/RNase